MTKNNTVGKTVKSKTIKKILIAQAKPESSRSPYFDLATNNNIEIEFFPFIKIEGIPSKEFRKQKIDIAAFTAVIFTSRNSIDHFFRVCDELKINVSQDTKYFCITEAVALYLQKFILYRKRKVFYGADGTNKSLFDIINKHKDNEKFLYPTSENIDNEITNWLKSKGCEFQTPILYTIVSNDLEAILKKKFDIISLFTPGAVRALAETKGFKQNDTVLAAHGENTFKAAEQAGLELQIKVGVPPSPGMVAALDKFVSAANAKTKKS